MSAPSHIPSPGANLPPSLYGQFDIKPTPDGGKRYVLPHNFTYSVMHALTRPAVIVGCMVIGFLATFYFLRDIPFVPLLHRLGFAAAFGALFILMLSIPVMLYCDLFGKRAVSTITIRSDGLILNDTSFFPAAHIHEICYGVTTSYKDGRPAEFAPKVEIQVGMAWITLADKLEQEAGRLFERRFREDTRRYWHHHN